MSAILLCSRGAPGVCHVTGGGTGGVGDAQVPEGEDAGGAGHGCAGGQVGGVLGAGGVLGGGAVPPPVGHHRVVGVDHGGAPGGGRVRIGAPVVLNTVVCEREDAGLIGRCKARVGHPEVGQVGPFEQQGRGEAGSKEVAGEKEAHAWDPGTNSQ